jgi:hypothetical protein
MSDYIRIKEGMPLLRDFASGEGTPIVIDVTTRIAYYLYKNMIFPLAPNPSSVNAFSSGFSNGFS